jgi:2-furoate---CoA ligase
VTIGETDVRHACRFDEWLAVEHVVMPRADPNDLSMLLYTSGTTDRPQGVPRRHRTERAAALAHIAQNFYARYGRTLGVMPPYHTMGIRLPLAMALIDGYVFVVEIPKSPVGKILRRLLVAGDYQTE